MGLQTRLDAPSLTTVMPIGNRTEITARYRRGQEAPTRANPLGLDREPLFLQESMCAREL
jgi:hypothetical protein